MATNMNTVPESHRDMLVGLISRLQTDERAFYQRGSSAGWLGYHICALVVLLAAALGTLAAGIFGEGEYKAYGRCVLLCLSTLGTIAAGLPHIFKFRDIEALRESGRIELEDIIANAQSLLLNATDEQGWQAAYHSVRERAKQLDVSQHKADAALRAEAAEKKPSPKP